MHRLGRRALIAARLCLTSPTVASLMERTVSSSYWRRAGSPPRGRQRRGLSRRTLARDRPIARHVVPLIGLTRVHISRGETCDRWYRWRATVRVEYRLGRKPLRDLLPDVAVPGPRVVHTAPRRGVQHLAAEKNQLAIDRIVCERFTIAGRWRGRGILRRPG